MWHVYLSIDLSIYFFPINYRLIDPSIYPLRCTHGTGRLLQYTGQAEMDALATSIGMGEKSEAYGLVHSALAESEVQQVLETRWFYQPFLF